MKIKILFTLIIALAAALRLFLLDSVPPHPSLDEVSIGYNAYSIAQTGKDEYANMLPILLRAYDDWRPALYVYLVIPFVKLFGLSVTAVRMPSALLAITSVAATYFIAKQIFATKISRKFGKNLKTISLFSMFLVAVSPWHIYISRLGHEVNAGLSFFIFGLLFFLKYVSSDVKNNLTKLFLPASAVCFALSFNAYQSMKVFIPLLAVVLFVLFYKKILTNRRLLIVSVIAGILVVTPVLIESAKPQALIRYQATNVFQDIDKRLEDSAQRVKHNKDQGFYQTTLFDNRRIEYANVFLEAYLSHYNPVYLFTNTGNESFKVQQFGLLYIFMIPALVYGAICVVQEKSISKKKKIFLLFWSAVAILPGAISNGYPHAMRTIQLLPVPQLVAAAGIALVYSHISRIKNKKIAPAAKTLLVAVILFFTTWFAHAYFVNFKQELSHHFQYGVIEALQYSEENKQQYEKIVVSNKDNLLQSYMYYLFLTEKNPASYQEEGGTISGGFAQKHAIEKYLFSTEDANAQALPNSLYVTNPGELPTGEVKVIHKIYNSSNEEVIWISESTKTNELKE